MFVGRDGRDGIRSRWSIGVVRCTAESFSPTSPVSLPLRLGRKGGRVIVGSRGEWVDTK